MLRIRDLAEKVTRRVDAAALLLAFVALWFLTVGTPMRAEKDDAAAFVFMGAAVTRFVDVGGERRRERAAEDVRRAQDLDETRRLLYMVLALPAAPRHGDLVATAANALAHHGHAIPVDESLPMLTVVANGGDTTGEAGRWIQARVAEITRRLGDHASGAG